MSDTDAVSAFSSLDELIQVIYNGRLRFVALSSTDETSWKIRLGLGESNGRWWEGCWGEKQIRQAAKAASCSIEALGDMLAAAFAQGEMYIENWSAKKGAEIKFILGTNTNHPAHVPLVELSSEDAAAFATDVFVDIAIQAKDRKSRLHPLPFEIDTSKPTSITRAPTVKASASKASAASAGSSTSDRKAREEIRALKAELARERSKHYSPPTSPSGKRKRKVEDEAERIAGREKRPSSRTTEPLGKDRPIQDISKLYSIAKGNRSAAATAAPRGASLANPTKKARRYQTLEFGSDDD